MPKLKLHVVEADGTTTKAASVKISLDDGPKRDLTVRDSIAEVDYQGERPRKVTLYGAWIPKVTLVMRDDVILIIPRLRPVVPSQAPIVATPRTAASAMRGAVKRAEERKSTKAARPRGRR